MFSKSALVLAVAAALRLVYADAAADNKAAEADLVGKLRLAPLATDRINLLSTDDEFEFDFFDPKAAATVGKGGKIVTANAATFPAVIGTGSAMAVGFLDACSMNTPHMHPRATEMQISVNSTIRTGMITENGARFIMTELPPGSMTIFPMGSIHFQVNDGCDPALFVASFNNEDPGALQVAQRFFGLPPDIVDATLGDIGVKEVQGLESKIPDNVALGTAECLKRCGLQRLPQPTTQRQPRVSGNAFPDSSYSASKYNTGYNTETKAYNTDTKVYNTDTKAYNTDTKAYNTDTKAYNTDTYGYNSKTKTYGKPYSTPAAQSYTKATATMTHDGKTWTTTYTSYAGSAYPTYAPSPVNHIIKVGAEGLNFTPPSISAAIGDTVTFEFHPKNHTVTQSSFLHPCKSLAETSTTGEVGFKSGFVFVPDTATSFSTFTITVNDTAPIWGYCGQQGPPVHCTEGMVFAINAVESGPNNFEAFQALAKAGKISTSASATSGYGAYPTAGRHLSGDLAAAAAPDGGNGGSSAPSPALIALLAINGLLVVGLIVLAVLYFRKRRAAARVSRHKQLYTSISATGEPIFVAPTKLGGQYEEKDGVPGDETPLTHGLTHGPYYDPHEPGSRPPSRPVSRSR